MDPRNTQLAKNLVNYSVKLQPGEKILIETVGTETENLIKEIVKEVHAVGGLPYVNITLPSIQRELLMHTSEETLAVKAELDAQFMSQMDAYIAVRSGDNLFELSDVPTENMNAYNIATRPVLTTRLGKKWVVLRYPNASMAQSAKMSKAAFAEFYYNVCCLDYAKMDRAEDALVALMNKTDRVHIKGPGTDLRFSIKDIPAIKCSGECNIPDGEVYTAPVIDSVEGHVTYNIGSMQNGFAFENVRLAFEKGKIVSSTANDTERITAIFDRDPGARFIGEFAIGFNPYITLPMYDTLFDEKIAGSFHFTPGNAYEIADNGNRSALHWDLVSIQTPEYGGGEIWFDGVLIRKDGRFVIPELECLNPENLV